MWYDLGPTGESGVVWCPLSVRVPSERVSQVGGVARPWGWRVGTSVAPVMVHREDHEREVLRATPVAELLSASKGLIR